MFVSQYSILIGRRGPKIGPRLPCIDYRFSTRTVKSFFSEGEILGDTVTVAVPVRTGLTRVINRYPCSVPVHRFDVISPSKTAGLVSMTVATEPSLLTKSRSVDAPMVAQKYTCCMYEAVSFIAKVMVEDKKPLIETDATDTVARGGLGFVIPGPLLQATMRNNVANRKILVQAIWSTS